MSRPRWKRIWIIGFSRLRLESQSLTSAIEQRYEVAASQGAGTMDRSSADPGGLGDFFAVWHAAGRAAPGADDRAGGVAGRDDRLVQADRDHHRADLTGFASDTTGVVDSSRHHLVWHCQQAGDLPGISRLVFPDPARHHSWCEELRP